MDPFTIFFLLILILSIIIHEVSHGFAAEMLGDPTARLQGRLTLNPVPHIDLMGSIILPALLVLTNSGFLFGWAKPVPYNPYNLRNKRWGEAIVAAAGPGVNALLAVVFGIIIRVGADTLSSSFLALAAIIVYTNIMLAFFNLLPIPPLDGSKLLKSVLPFRAALAYERLEASLMQGGLIVLFLFFLLLTTALAPLFHATLSFFFALITGIPLDAVM